MLSSGGEFVGLMGLGVITSLYLSLATEVALMVGALVGLVCVFILVLMALDCYVWAMFLGLLYVGSMMVLFSYTTMLTGVVDSFSGGGSTSLSFWKSGSLTLLLVLTLFCGIGGNAPSWGPMGALGILHFYSSWMIWMVVILLVSTLVVCLKLCSEVWY